MSTAREERGPRAVDAVAARMLGVRPARARHAPGVLEHREPDRSSPSTSRSPPRSRHGPVRGRVLDWGAGWGQTSLLLRAHGARVVAYDVEDKGAAAGLLRKAEVPYVVTAGPGLPFAERSIRRGPQLRRARARGRRAWRARPSSSASSGPAGGSSPTTFRIAMRTRSGSAARSAGSTTSGPTRGAKRRASSRAQVSASRAAGPFHVLPRNVWGRLSEPGARLPPGPERSTIGSTPRRPTSRVSAGSRRRGRSSRIARERRRQSDGGPAEHPWPGARGRTPWTSATSSTARPTGLRRSCSTASPTTRAHGTAWSRSWSAPATASSCRISGALDRRGSSIQRRPAWRSRPPSGETSSISWRRSRSTGRFSSARTGARGRPASRRRSTQSACGPWSRSRATRSRTSRARPGRAMSPGRSPALVPVVLQHGAGSDRAHDEPARAVPPSLAHVVAGVGLRRRHLRAHGDVLRQPRLRRRRHPLLPPPARQRAGRAPPGRRRGAPGRAAPHRGPDPRPPRGGRHGRSGPHIGRRGTPVPGRLCPPGDPRRGALRPP